MRRGAVYLQNLLSVIAITIAPLVSSPELNQYSKKKQDAIIGKRSDSPTV